jgi:hypothetical protein
MRYKTSIALIVLSLGLCGNCFGLESEYLTIRAEVVEAAHEGTQYSPNSRDPEPPSEEVILDTIWMAMNQKNGYRVYKHFIKWESTRTGPDKPYPINNMTYYDCKWRCFIKIYAIKK